MYLIRTFFHILKVLLILIPSQNRNIKQFLSSNPDLTLTKKTIKRITLYSILCTYIGYFFSLMRNKKLSKLELKLLQNLSVLIPLYDDLMDDLHFSHGQIRELVLSQNLNEHPYLKIISPLAYHILDEMKDQNYFLTLLEKIGEIQDQSLKQTNDVLLTHSELEQITNQKGGLSLEMIRLMCFHTIEESEKEFTYVLGAQFQFINDIFDIYKDRESKTQTLCTNTSNFTDLKNRFESLNETLIEKSLVLSFPKKDIKMALYFFLPVIARGQVAVNQLTNLKTTQPFSLQNYTRKELVCDMEKAKNILLNIKYYFAQLKKINPLF